jgi:class 3 adenylate cyclase
MSEVRALLLTDVVDSTKLSERLGDAAMAELWAAHDRLARDLLPVWRGREIDKTDGMLLLFEAAADAVNYALAYHRGLAALPVALKATSTPTSGTA